MKNMIKILYVYPQFNLGGTEMVLLNIIKNLKHNYDITLLAEKKGNFEQEFEKYGAKIKYISFNDNEKIYNFLKDENFDVIHTNTCAEMGQILKLSQKAGINIRIAHSHNARTDLPKLTRLLKIFKSRDIEKYANIFFACSIEAAKWLFPIKYRKSIIVKNGINIEDFKFNNLEKKRIRKQYNISDNDIVIGTVGRWSKEKNHIFLLKVIQQLYNLKQNIKLIIVGDGPEKENLVQFINENNLEKCIFILGSQKNVNDYLSAMDIFVLPSYAEGLGLSIVEAQYNGLISIASNRVPDEADIGEKLFYKVKLDEAKWIDLIIKKINNNDFNRKLSITSKKYDINDIINIVEEVYLQR